MERRKQEAAKLRARGLSLREIAARCGVAERTIERWTTLPEFQAYVRDFEKREPLVAKDGQELKIGSKTGLEEKDDDDLDDIPVMELADRVLRRIIRDGSDLSKLKAIQILIENEIPIEMARERRMNPTASQAAIMRMIEAEGAKLAAAQMFDS
jgi:transcriptional regulator with XRE-family HTH domain